MTCPLPLRSSLLPGHSDFLTNVGVPFPALNQILFEAMNVPALFVSMQAVLSL